VEAGVSGLPRPREWDATAFVALPELAGSDATRLEGHVLAESVVGELPERLVAELDTELERPYAVLAVRRTGEHWAVGARRLRAEELRLPAATPGERLEVVVSPEGERTAAADGAPVEGWVDPAVAEAIAEIERRGRKRFEAFAARADKLDGDRWELTIDPL
jgi:hypothetical protein